MISKDKIKGNLNNASDEDVQEALDNIDTNAVVMQIANSVTLEEMDNSITDWNSFSSVPQINYRHKRYVENGGKIVILKENGIVKKMITKSSSDPDRKRIAGFEKEKNKFIENRVDEEIVKKVEKYIKDKKEKPPKDKEKEKK